MSKIRVLYLIRCLNKTHWFWENC